MECNETPQTPESSIFLPGSTPEDRTDSVSSACALGAQPNLVTGLLRQIFIQHFAATDNVMAAALRGKLETVGPWRNDDTTGIVIESVTKFDPTKIETRPAVTIKRNDWRWKNLTPGDRVNGIGVLSGAESPTYRTNDSMYWGMWHGSHTVFAIAREGAETEIVAKEVADVIRFNAPEVRRSLGYHRFALVGIGTLGVLKEATENYVVPISVAYAVEEGWELQQQAPRFKKLGLDITGGAC